VADAVKVWSMPNSFVPSEVEGRLPASVPAPFDYGLRPSLRTNGIGPVCQDRKVIPLVVAEKNQGGKMVKSVLHTADPNLRVKLVTATVGKAERAAPVAMLFEAGRVVLHGRFPELEGEMLGMIAGGEYEGFGASPDRADAMVWGLTELMLAPEQAPPRVRSL
jgi:phage terminase large subunit-like protein